MRGKGWRGERDRTQQQEQEKEVEVKEVGERVEVRSGRAKVEKVAEKIYISLAKS